MGAPNEWATATLAARLAHVLKGDSSSPPDHSVECRDYACKLSVLDELQDPSAGRWMAQMTSPELLEVIERGVLFKDGDWVKDPIGGREFRRRTAYMKLVRFGKETPTGKTQ
jgi:hypothetical protein